MMIRQRCGCLLSREQRRNVWTCRTLISSSPDSLVQALPKHLPSSAAAASTTVYALSKNIPSNLIKQARSSLDSDKSVGVLSEQLPPQLVAHLAPDQAASGRNMTGPFSIAVATYTPRDKDHKMLTFKSTVQGRPNIALGREIKQQSSTGGGGDKAFEEFLRTGKMSFGDAEKQDGGPRDLQELEGVSKAQVRQVTFFSTDRNAPFLSSLAKYSKHAQILGLMATSTPFHSETNAPFTLFYGNETLSAGAVGVALVDSSGKPSDIQGNVEYSGLQAIDVPIEVTKAQGNIVLELENQNAARLVLEKIKSMSTSPTLLGKDKEFYAAVFDRKPTGHLNTNDAVHVARIMSGDPSRGAISIETTEDVRPGYWLTMLHRPEPPSYATFDKTLAQFNFISVEPSDQLESHQQDGSLPQDGPVAVVDGFVAASENGIVIGRKDREPYVTSIEHVVGRTVEERLKDKL